MKFSFILACMLAWVASSGDATAQGTVARLGTAPERATPPQAVFLNATPMMLKASGVLPRAAAPAEIPRRASGARASFPRAGFEGGPEASPMQIVPEDRPSATAPAQDSLTPRAAGGSYWPFSVSRAEVTPKQPRIITRYPYRAVGRLAFRYLGQNTWCSAALIDKGLAVTSASCVAEFGKGFYPDAKWAFIPGYHRGRGAYGTFRYRDVFVPKSYLDGTDSCVEPGLQCENDVAVIVLRPNAKYPGTLAGWFGWDFSENHVVLPRGLDILLTQLAQLGYAENILGGGELLRSTALGTITDSPGRNLLFGSALRGGSMGAPVIIDLGGLGSDNIQEFLIRNSPNTIVGVTGLILSDGVSFEPHLALATPFNPENIGELVSEACRTYPAACRSP